MGCELTLSGGVSFRHNRFSSPGVYVLDGMQVWEVVFYEQRCAKGLGYQCVAR